MFENAIEIANSFTRPIHSISRNYGSKTIQAGAASLFFINSDGWALTCKHVASLIINSDQLLQKRQSFIAEISQIRGQKKETHHVHELIKKYGYSKDASYELYNMFVNCVEGNLSFQLLLHGKYDVALIHFQDYTKINCDNFPLFPKKGSDLKPGKYLCRLGYPFVEFNNYEYDDATESIHWTETGRKITPRFPIEGMVTRQLAETNETIFGFELSTPGLRGQSGGPAFDTEGVIWGMQSSTAHLDLDFDVNQEVLRNGEKKKVTDSAFLHVGHCIHVEILKAFMTENNVKYLEK